MDFHSLTRKDLQALCKKNKIPANLTNVAMADALTALPKVEGLDELGNPQQSPERTTNGDPRTACRTSTRRKLVKVEPESSQILTRTRRTTRKTVTGNESNDVKLPETPAPNNKPRGPAAASTRRKIDSQLIECGEDDEKLEIKEKSDVAETPAIQSSRKKAPVSTRKKVEINKDEKSVQRVYGTRHSVRVLEKTMEKLSLKEERKVEAVKIEGLCDEIESKVELDEPLENECENHEAVEDSKTNGDDEVDQLPNNEAMEDSKTNGDDEVNQLPKNECENNEAVEDSKTNGDDEVDQLPKNECGMKNKANEDEESEVDFEENQNIAQFLGSESEAKVELPEETESSANSDNLSSKEIDIIQESIGEKDAEITENPEENTMDSSDLEMEMEKENQNESNDNSPFAIQVDEFNTNEIDAQIDGEFEEEPDESGDSSSSTFAMEGEKLSSITDAIDEISVLVNKLTSKKEELTEDESKTLEMNANDAQMGCECDEFDLDLDKTESSDEEKSPLCPPVSEGEVGDKMTSGEEIEKEKVIVEEDNSIINKENMENNGEEDDKLLEMSLRQLTKALKEKLQIKNNNGSKVGSRQALKKLPENAAAEAE